MADEARRLGFEVTTGVGGTGVVAVLRNGAGPTLLLRADMDGAADGGADRPALRQPRARPDRARGSTRSSRIACGHDTHMTAWIGTARRLVGAEGPLARHSGDDRASPARRPARAPRRCWRTACSPASRGPNYAIAFHDSATLPAGTIGYTPGPTLANVDSVDMIVRGVGGHGAAPHTTRDPIVLASAHRHLAADPGQPRARPARQRGGDGRQLPGRDQAQHHLRRGAAADHGAQLHARDAPAMLLDGIARIARGEAIAAGVPEDRMPVVTCARRNRRRRRSTPTVDRAARPAASAPISARSGCAQIRPVMAGEDFGRFRLADPSLESLIFWVGGVPQAQYDAAVAAAT